jgi:hypothetical protein
MPACARCTSASSANNCVMDSARLWLVRSQLYLCHLLCTSAASITLICTAYQPCFQPFLIASSLDLVSIVVCVATPCEECGGGRRVERKRDRLFSVRIRPHRVSHSCSPKRPPTSLTTSVVFSHQVSPWERNSTRRIACQSPCTARNSGQISACHTIARSQTACLSATHAHYVLPGTSRPPNGSVTLVGTRAALRAASISDWRWTAARSLSSPSLCPCALPREPSSTWKISCHVSCAHTQRK